EAVRIRRSARPRSRPEGDRATIRRWTGVRALIDLHTQGIPYPAIDAGLARVRSSLGATRARARKVACQADLRAPVHAKSLETTAVRNGLDLGPKFTSDFEGIDETGQRAEKPRSARRRLRRSQNSTISRV